MTAAHCISTTVSFTYAGSEYTGNVNTNSYYPSIGSMYTVYLGLQDKSTISNTGAVTAPAVKMSVSKVVVVIIEKR